MDTRTALIAAAERLYHEHGFMATGMDTLAKAAGMSSRTLYKHAGSKTDLIVAVLDARDRRFFELVDGPSVASLFAAHETWIAREGAHGCLFLRALGETGGAEPAIAAAVLRHKERMRTRIGEMVARDLGREDPDLAQQVLLLFEGAVAASAWQGVGAVRDAARAASKLLEGAR